MIPASVGAVAVGWHHDREVLLSLVIIIYYLCSDSA